jgi:hypothetical protein
VGPSTAGERKQKKKKKKKRARRMHHHCHKNRARYNTTERVTEVILKSPIKSANREPDRGET